MIRNNFLHKGKTIAFSWLFTGLFLFLLVACNKNKQDDPIPVDQKTMEQLVVDRNFKWETTKMVSFAIVTRDNMDNPLANVRIMIYSAHPDSGGVYMFGGVTDASGKWNDTQPIPSSMNNVHVSNDYVGLVRGIVLPVTGNTVTGIFGGKAPKPVVYKSGGGVYKSTMTGVYYMGTYNSLGVPDYLEPVNDPVEAALLNDLNASLPERQPVPVNHPEYLANTAPDNLALTELCDVWITYITEGAGWYNALGFFTFNTASPPTNANQIDSIKIIFPNLSNAGANSSGNNYKGGGGLYPGNKVYLGRFPAGKSIGLVIFANGWKNNAVGNENYRIYSVQALNPETNPALRKHTVLLKDQTRHSILFGFEDWRRDQGGDEDFNDGILYIKANPVTAINTDGMPPITTTQPDGDGDGVPDVFDDYPADPTKAYNNWYPSKTTYSTLAFEDLWPGKGDYDFNDLVISYRFNQVTNADSKVVQVKAEIITEAMGANLHNAFAFQLPFTPDKVVSVSGHSLKHNLVTLSANGTEAGQSKAVVVVYDDAYDRLPPPGIGVGSNTEKDAPYVTPDTMRLTINYVAGGIAASQAGIPPYNPFIIVGGDRNREVHLSDQPPTDMVNGAEFGTYDDDSKPVENRYYKTKTNLPWAIQIAGKFSYVYERQPVNTGYLKFNQWAESSGASYPDWYSNTAAGYRDNSKIYTH